MWQDCSLPAVQRKTAFVEQSWWPEFDMFGSTPSCSFPWQKLLPKLVQKNCHTTLWIYPWKTMPTIADSILVSDQTDLFSFATHGDEYGMPRKALPRKQAKVDTGHQYFSVVAQGWAKIHPRLTQGSCQMKKPDGTSKTIAQINADWKVEKAQYAEFNVPTFDKIAVWQLCKKRQPLWNSHDGLNLTCLDQCHRVRSHGNSSSQSWRKRIVIQQSEFSL